jgi:hypothetical protein
MQPEQTETSQPTLVQHILTGIAKDTGHAQTVSPPKGRRVRAQEKPIQSF